MTKIVLRTVGNFKGATISKHFENILSNPLGIDKYEGFKPNSEFFLAKIIIRRCLEEGGAGRLCSKYLCQKLLHMYMWEELPG